MQYVFAVYFHRRAGDEGMVPRRGGGLWGPGARTDSRWFDVTHARPLHRLYNPKTFDDWRIKVDYVHQREYSLLSRLLLVFMSW